MPELLASKKWDKASGETLLDPTLYDTQRQVWVRDVSPPRTQKPSLLEAHRAFVKRLRVSQDKQSGYITVEFDHLSPIVAANWVTWLVNDVNSAVKAQEVEEANRSIEYLKRQAGNTSLADLQAMFFELIQSQTETMMLAEARTEYVFKTIDPAVVPEIHSKPNRAAILIIGLVLGFVTGGVTVFIRSYITQSAYYR